ncbi:hypothetical protein PF001_g18949 [Phytophthora fragariae]|uniref:Uncharacterized protein n=2 Tax=Phytophthora TaxID=4783 RepID=A0A6A3ILX8_9STRA|nr:hypothetical protein PR002_g28656 [Phytophthora rubi]KAE8981535.1 hypothetical protein PR001_g23977 [Phytophthora rubi]KAE9291906.1 hypothetical protein PF001_g18949 [Phytophthora fragariae]
MMCEAGGVGYASGLEVFVSPLRWMQLSTHPLFGEPAAQMICALQRGDE